MRPIMSNEPVPEENVARRPATTEPMLQALLRLPEKAQWLTTFLTTLGKTMTGVYILHYLIFGVLAAAIRIQTLGDKLLVIALTLIFSMALSLLLLRIPGVRKLISL